MADRDARDNMQEIEFKREKRKDKEEKKTYLTLVGKNNIFDINIYKDKKYANIHIIKIKLPENYACEIMNIYMNYFHSIKHEEDIHINKFFVIFGLINSIFKSSDLSLSQFMFGCRGYSTGGSGHSGGGYSGVHSLIQYIYIKLIQYGNENDILYQLYLKINDYSKGGKKRITEKGKRLFRIYYKFISLLVFLENTYETKTHPHNIIIKYEKINFYTKKVNGDNLIDVFEKLWINESDTNHTNSPAEAPLKKPSPRRLAGRLEALTRSNSLPRPPTPRRLAGRPAAPPRSKSLPRSPTQNRLAPSNVPSRGGGSITRKRKNKKKAKKTQKN